MRNRLFTCIIKIGGERGWKSVLERALRIDKNRHIEAPRVVSYRFLLIGRPLEAILETLWGHLELKNRLGGFMRSGKVSKPTPDTKTSANLEPKLVQKSIWKAWKNKNHMLRKPTLNSMYFFDDFWCNFDDFWCQNGCNFGLNLQSVSNMLNMRKYWKNQWFFNDFAC